MSRSVSMQGSSGITDFLSIDTNVNTSLHSVERVTMDCMEVKDLMWRICGSLFRDLGEDVNCEAQIQHRKLFCQQRQTIKILLFDKLYEPNRNLPQRNRQFLGKSMTKTAPQNSKAPLSQNSFTLCIQQYYNKQHAFLIVSLERTYSSSKKF
mmetsp:Transcript_23202/g.32390  ORF Transcript_23202/g.32390 Transcript_23202/m.32390 type:complete len:152 (-) Transcript_23202:1445-1900(-)